MFNHFHPYKPYLNKDTKTIIIGTLPPPRFCINEYKKEDVLFCYGSKDNQLWRVLDKIYNLNLLFDNSDKAVFQRKKFLDENKIGICDIVESCQRDKIDASDNGMQNIVLRDILGYLKRYKYINKIIFTGKSESNGPLYFFKKELKKVEHKLTRSDSLNLKVFELNIFDRSINLYCLTSPSNAANKSIGSNKLFKKIKNINSNYNTFEFRVDEYQKIFQNH